VGLREHGRERGDVVGGRGIAQHVAAHPLHRAGGELRLRYREPREARRGEVGVAAQIGPAASRSATAS
jgi:hypothetical protein